MTYDYEQTVEMVLNCIFPEDYYTGSQEPQGEMVERLPTKISCNRSGGFDAAAKNLRPMADIAERMHELGLSGVAISNMAGLIDQKVREASSAAIQAALFADDKVSAGGANFRDNWEAPFGIDVESSYTAYSEQTVANVKHTLRKFFTEGIKAKPEYFALDTDVQHAKNVVVLTP